MHFSKMHSGEVSSEDGLYPMLYLYTTQEIDSGCEEGPRSRFIEVVEFQAAGCGL